MPKLHYLKDLWDEKLAATLDEPELLRYRSNLLGADLRITNFGGGNTSSKVTEADPLTGQPAQVLWVKGSGGDLGTIQRRGFATLYMDKLMALEGRYEGVAKEDAMVEFYPLCTFGPNPTAASIDTPLHAFLPFAHVDHLHPDWAIAMAAAANGREKMEEFNREFGHSLVWLPWQRPGFELGLMLRRAVEENPGCDGIVLGCHGLFTWGETQRACYLSSLTMIDQLGQFVLRHVEKKGRALFGGAVTDSRGNRKQLALELMPFLRGRISARKRVIGSWTDAPAAMGFVNSKDAATLAHMGTSCPDHFIRTKIRPMLVPAESGDDLGTLKQKIESALETYRQEYIAYYNEHAEPGSPALRDPTPAVVLIPGIGMFSFGKNKTESRITGEFYINAIHVMEGATALGEGDTDGNVPQAGAAAPPEAFHVHTNYVALPAREAFRIEYWILEDAKLRRQPPEKEFSRKIALVVGGASDIGRAVALLAAERGAHVMIADCDTAGAEAVAKEAQAIAGREAIATTILNLEDRAAIAAAMEATVAAFGGLDVLISTATTLPPATDGDLPDSTWPTTLALNVTANYLLADEARRLFSAQRLDASVVFTSSAAAVVPRRGSEAYDVSQAALSHLVRELAVSLGPEVRVNGISPAPVMRNQPIEPADCAPAILFLAGQQARCTSGHLIPVDGGMPEAFLR